MPDGQVFYLVHNYPLYKYEWVYVERKALNEHSREHGIA